MWAQKRGASVYNPAGPGGSSGRKNPPPGKSSGSGHGPSNNQTAKIPNCEDIHHPLFAQLTNPVAMRLTEPLTEALTEPLTELSSNDAPSTTATAGIVRPPLFQPRRTLHEQANALADTDIQSLPADVAQLPTIQSGRRRFVLERFLHKRTVRTSWISQYGIFIVEIGVATAEGRQPVFWCCSFCDKLYNAVATTTGNVFLAFLRWPSTSLLSQRCLRSARGCSAVRSLQWA
ncbi:hypothetical protein N657DRAFT_404933 [Parathielavia appendiculata]|uniref:Uncharacterized protein n=1 Tax=Parathielavia appendiculata TaxID=2587402 RepID=A0AAN6TPC8_9PEZI|nr:hypothetical protein N657DRAFT_404933 [Parathielavia appendiculata]